MVDEPPKNTLEQRVKSLEVQHLPFLQRFKEDALFRVRMIYRGIAVGVSAALAGVLLTPGMGSQHKDGLMGDVPQDRIVFISLPYIPLPDTYMSDSLANPSSENFAFLMSADPFFSLLEPYTNAPKGSPGYQMGIAYGQLGRARPERDAFYDQFSDLLEPLGISSKDEFSPYLKLVYGRAQNGELRDILDGDVHSHIRLALSSDKTHDDEIYIAFEEGPQMVISIDITYNTPGLEGPIIYLGERGAEDWGDGIPVGTMRAGMNTNHLSLAYPSPSLVTSIRVQNPFSNKKENNLLDIHEVGIQYDPWL